ncbi:MAG: SigE family RNA polymerase sigma factor [Frankiales bacterium]|nr:SigE family RNA polymerase sigma factor [Frankiales bacterium]
MSATPGPPDFEQFVAARRPSLRRTAYLICGDWDRAEDAVQDALARLFVHWRRASRADSVDAYARRAVVNAVLSDGRRAWRRERATDTVPETSYADHADAVGSRAAIASALASLGPSQRAIVVLRYWDDLSVEETAAVLRCSTGNVKSQAARGLARLREALADVEVDHD